MIIEKLVVGPLMENSYLVADEETGQGIVIDAGDEPERISERAEQLHVKVETLVCTHGHVDHVGAVGPLKRLFSAEFCLHREDEWFLADTSKHGLEFGMHGLENVTVDRYIKEGDRITFGNCHLEVIETPGHSPGSVILLCGGDAFVGDLIFAGSIGRTDLPGGDYGAIIASFENKLLTLPEETRLHPGHGESTTLSIERQYNPFLRGLVARRNRVRGVGPAG